jgi:hypothetical protein
MALSSSVAAVHDRGGEVGEIENVVRRSVKIATHLRPDLDAIFAVWVCQRIRSQNGLLPLKVLFIPANTQGVESGILAVDIGPDKGLRQFGQGYCLKRSALGGSASMAVYRALNEEDRYILESVAKAISDADETGDTIHTQILKSTGNWGNLQVRNGVMATTLWSVFHAMSNQMRDQDLLQSWTNVFEGMMIGGQDRLRASSAVRKAELHHEGLLAVLPHGAPRATSRAAYERGAVVVLFSSKLGGDRWTLGLSKKAGDTSRLNLSEGKAEFERVLPGIFVKPEGFMLGWTSKAPLVCTQEQFLTKREALIKASIEIVGKLLSPKR